MKPMIIYFIFVFCISVIAQNKNADVANNYLLNAINLKSYNMFSKYQECINKFDQNIKKEYFDDPRVLNNLIKYLEVISKSKYPYNSLKSFLIIEKYVVSNAEYSEILSEMGSDYFVENFKMAFKILNNFSDSDIKEIAKIVSFKEVNIAKMKKMYGEIKMTIKQKRFIEALD